MTKKSGKLKAAMIGVGDISDLHYPAYCDFEHAELVAICDRNEQLLEQRSAAWGVQKITTDYREILNNPDIDIVEINTPHQTHKQLVIEALAAGKHVGCQKPIATSIADAQAMVDAEKKASGQFRVFENFVFYPAYVKAKELIEAGEIGEILSIRFKLGSGLFGSRWIPLKVNLWHMMESEKGMGWAIFDDGYHKLSLAIHFVTDIEAVKGFIDRSFRYVDVPAQLIWRYKGCNTLGSFDIAFSPNLYTRSKYFPADERVDIVGSKGIINLTQCTGRIVDEAPLILYKDGKRTLFEDMDTDWQASFTDGIRDLPLSLSEGRDTLISGRRALDIMKFAYALILAAKKGIEVRPDDITDEVVSRELLEK